MNVVAVDLALSKGVKGFLYEIFSGIQGESMLVGERQIFVRFSGCELNCTYCDTPDAHERTNISLVEQTCGRGDFAVRPNPATVGEVVSAVQQLETFPGLHHSVSITGGEPLAQSKFAGALARELKERGFRIFLETNGEFPERLPDILLHTDIVSMDVKLPSATGGIDLMRQHQLFLRAAMAKEVHVKVVLTSITTDEELMRAVKMVAECNKDIPLILQPVTATGKLRPPSPGRILELQANCKAELHAVRVIPQCHKIMEQR